MSKYEYVKKNYENLVREVKGYEEKFGRSITIVAVTKSGTDEELKALVLAGASDLGENRPTELKRRAELLREAGLTPRFHEIGNLQRNKVKVGDILQTALFYELKTKKTLGFIYLHHLFLPPSLFAPQPLHFSAQEGVVMPS